MMPEFVKHRLPHPACEIVSIFGNIAMGNPKDGDLVRHRGRVQHRLFGDRNPFIEAEEVFPVKRMVLDDHHEVVECRPELLGHLVKDGGHEFLELIFGHMMGHSQDPREDLTPSAITL
jgi:hypothetical protein